MTDLTYTPEITLTELRHARDNDPLCAELAGIMQRAAAAAIADNWPEPHDREQAGLGCVVAAASLNEYAKGSHAAETLMSAVGLFGLALVESARTDSHCHEVRDADNEPCTARPGESHVDEEGDVYVTVPLNGKEAGDADQ